MSGMYITSAVGVKESIKSFNDCVPIGTEVEYQGRKYRTWSHAGLGERRVPVVFLDNANDKTPVPIEELTIAGVEKISQRRKSGESHGKGLGQVNPSFAFQR